LEKSSSSPKKRISQLYRREIVATINTFIYLARKTFPRLQFLPPELPPWQSYLRWPGRAIWKVWLHRVLLPSVERKRPKDEANDADKPPMPAQLGKSLRRVALFCQDPSKYGLLTDLGAAFKRMGIEVVSAARFLEGVKFSKFLNEFHPDFVFEINRSKNQILDCHSRFHHIAWIQDHSVGRRRITAGFGGSDKVYSVVDPAIVAFEPAQVHGWTLLQMAVDPQIHRPIPGLKPRWDVSTIGYLAPPLSEAELAAPLWSGNISTTLGAIHADLLRFGIDHSNLHVRELKSFLLDSLRSHNPAYEPDETLDWLVALYDHRVLRSMDRADYVRRSLAATDSVALFGNGHWPFDRKLSRYFGGRINGGSERSSVYCLSKIVMHNGNLMIHDRSLEAMACGTCVILNHSKFENSRSGITPYFTDGEHFVFFDKNSISAVTKELLADDKRRQHIGRQARARVLSGFTWQHRAKQIIDDFLSR